jgi:hypothetical protein
MALWIVVAAAIAVGFAIGTFWVVPVGAAIWVAVLAYFASTTDGTRPQLEGNLGLWIDFAETVLVSGGLLVGVVLQRRMRRRRCTSQSLD